VFGTSARHDHPKGGSVITKTICVLCLLASGLLLAADTSEETLGLKNGRYWSGLPADAQPYFLIGMFEGWTFRQL
jgi:hypothetical protein